MLKSPIVIVSAKRTPIGRFGGSFAKTPATELGGFAVKAALKEAGVNPDDVDSVLIGMARQAGARPNPARQVAFNADIPEAATAFTINQACASGLKSLQLAADELIAGRAKVVIAGGIENMSLVPHYLENMRDGYRLGDSKVIDGMYRDGFSCPLSNMVMGETAELLAVERKISRAEQDEFALNSQQKAAAAQEAGYFDTQIAPVTLVTRRGEIVVNKDEHVRSNTTIEGLGKLPGVFAEKDGTVTPGNASGITDGAAALVMMTADEAERRGLSPLAIFLDSQIAGTDPKRMGLGPVPATQQLFERTGLSYDDFGLFEINEAFAAQTLACLQEMPINPELLNVNGGSIALGHPIGCTGARITVTLLHEMKRRNVDKGLATLCVSGGLGITGAFELIS